MAFESKYDVWLVVVICFATACSIGAAAFILYLKFNMMNIIIVMILLLLGGVLPVWILLATGYQVLEGRLLITSGPFRWRIDLADIHKVEYSRDPFSSPALSLDRLSIKYGKDQQILVSPKDQLAFIKAIGQNVDKHKK